MYEEEIKDICESLLHKCKPASNNNMMACCPFHTKEDGSYENTPSFAISLTTGLWLCFGCDAKGNFRSLLKQLGVFTTEGEAGKYRFLLKHLDEMQEHDKPKINQLNPSRVFDHAPLEDSVLGLFDYCPVQLLEQGFEEDTLRKFDIGVDMDHRRITFPLRDFLGRLVGISGRATGAQYPRYKIYDYEYRKWGLRPRNTDKSVLLWNVHRVYPEVYFNRVDHVILTEGFKAVMWLEQLGFPNAVAALGNRLTEHQQWILERLGAKVYVLLDNNDAGKKGTAVAASLLAKTCEVRVATYKDVSKAQPSDLTLEEAKSVLYDTSLEYYIWKNKNNVQQPGFN